MGPLLFIAPVSMLLTMCFYFLLYMSMLLTRWWRPHPPRPQLLYYSTDADYLAAAPSCQTLFVLRGPCGVQLKMAELPRLPSILYLGLFPPGCNRSSSPSRNPA